VLKPFPIKINKLGNALTKPPASLSILGSRESPVILGSLDQKSRSNSAHLFRQ